MIVRDAPNSAPANIAPPTGPVRLGVIDYLNVRPVYDAILRREPPGDDTIQTMSGVPAQMNRALLSGDVDISNVSSYAYGQHVAEWLLIPRLSVAAHGRVESVLLFSWESDWRDLDGRNVALTDASATSVELVRLLCERRYGIQPRYVTMTGDLDSMLRDHAAALVIGDRALVERHAHRMVAGRGQPYCFDLAAEWQDWTALPFVFAVWAARVGRAKAIRASGVVELLRDAKAQGVARLDAIASEYAERLGLTRAICYDYLRLLDYDLSPRDQDGMRAFLEMANPGFAWSGVRWFEE